MNVKGVIDKVIDAGIFNKVQKNISDIVFYSQKNEYKSNSFDDFPIIDKKTVITNYSDFISKSLISRKWVSTVTSGSSGEILSVIWAENDYICSLSHLWRFRSKYGILPSDCFCTLHLNYKKDNRVLNSKVIIEKNCLSLSKCFVDDVSLDFYLKCISELRPKWFFVQPSFLYTLCLHLKRSNKKFPNSILFIELAGEYCSPEMYAFFKENLPDKEIMNMYGMQEFNGIAYGDERGLKPIEKKCYCRNY